MKFSTRTRYGLRFLIKLAANPQGQLLQLGELAREEEISPGYLEQIIRALKPLGILRSVRGSAGGYALACPPEKVNLEMVFLHLEGGVAPIACLTEEYRCPRMDVCCTRQFWEALDKHTRSFLRGVTLEQLVLNMRDAAPSPATPRSESAHRTKRSISCGTTPIKFRSTS